MSVLLISLQKRGGGAFDALGFSNGLCENRFRHDIIISEGNEIAGDFLDNKYRRVIKIPTYASSGGSFFLNSLLLTRPVRLIMAIRKAQPSVVHVTHFHPWVSLIFLARPFLGYKVIYAVHEDPYRRKDNNNPLIMGPLERMFIVRADRVAAYSDYMNRILAKHIPGVKIKTILLGAYDTFCPHFVHKGFHKKGTLRILFFGPIRKYKGVDDLVVAMAICRRHGVDATLTIAGKQDAFENILNTDQVKGLGITWIDKFLSREEVCGLMGEADVMAIPYKEATQTTPGALAIAYSIPAIGTKSGGLPEQVEDGVNGLLVSASDPEGLAVAIEKIANDRSLLEKFSEGAGQLYREKFSWVVIAQKAIQEVYDQERDSSSKRLK